MTQNALALLEQEIDEASSILRARQIAMLRPSVVPIVNVMQNILVANGKESLTMESFNKDLQDCVELGQATIRDLLTKYKKVDTWERGRTHGTRLECSDEEIEELLATGKFDVLLVESDCVLPDRMANKVGTKRLCEIAQTQGTLVLCCADRWKLWEDFFPPPSEEDLFEWVPLKLVSKFLVPGLT
ncbi:MAG: hypothetical protein SGBAC_001728 [Bacillariaceae sp.]